ncbi:MAG: EF-hand domain-containing protein [Methyloversatilis discipulorum]|uniref:EF-hand domain-containing protein n=1 Tax=Methyloversatilis discipulorum TaxID=1119528 RepID=UPI0026EC596A|nr:EF-hand domain-containing protein [Methyloversatilis discipulorum]MBT9516458.1 EF-hand domain-containing protein [Methyloversatilis discipulorum]
MSISGVGSNMASAMQSAMQANRPQKPDASAMAADVFALLDSSGKGYIDSSDLAGALESTGSSASAEDLLGAMDGDGDGKVTEQELGSLLQKVADQLEDSFGASRVGQAMGNRPPPPPPPPAGEDEGMSVEQLGAMAEEAEASGSAEASELAALVESFDEADTDGDGKVSFQEAMAFRESEEAASGASSDSRPPPPDETARDERMLARVFQMLQEYTGDSSTASTGSTLSVSA